MKKILIFTLLVFLLGFGLQALASTDIFIKDFDLTGDYQPLYDFGSRNFYIQTIGSYDCDAGCDLLFGSDVGFACGEIILLGRVYTGKALQVITEQPPCQGSFLLSGFYTDEPTGVLFGIPSDFAEKSLAYVGGLITDLATPIYILVGILLAMFLIEFILGLFSRKRK
jgi:hypothetical protein